LSCGESQIKLLRVLNARVELIIIHRQTFDFRNLSSNYQYHRLCEFSVEGPNATSICILEWTQKISQADGGKTSNH
jgi:hypothetical protein